MFNKQFFSANPYQEILKKEKSFDFAGKNVTFDTPLMHEN